MARKRAREVFFIVTSGGRAATYWLSHLLNRSSEIFCMHGYFPASKLAPGEKNAPDDFGRSGYEIGDIYDLDGSAKSRKEWAEILRQQWKIFDELSLDAYFDKMKETHQVKVYGNIHGYTYDSFIRKLKENPPEYDINFCNLTRHPVTRVQSFYKRFSHTKQWIPEPLETIAARKSNARNLRSEVLSRFSVDIYDDDKWLFHDTINRMIIQYAEAMLEGIPQIKSEDITNDRAQFKRLFAVLTEGRVELTEEMLSTDNFSRRLNRTLDEPVSPSDQFSAWEPWQQHVFKHLIRPEWLQAYEKIGYEISFINKLN